MLNKLHRNAIAMERQGANQVVITKEELRHSGPGAGTERLTKNQTRKVSKTLRVSLA